MLFRALLVFALLAVASSDCTTDIFSGDVPSATATSSGTCVAITFDCSSNIICSGGASAGQLASGNKLDLYFTTNANNIVGKQSVTYGDNSVSFDAPFTTVTSLNGADGIISNPANSSELLVGAQGPTIYRVMIATGQVIPVMDLPGVAFHLSPFSINVLLYANYNPGSLYRINLNADGTLSGPFQVTGDRSVNTVIKTPSGYYYTTSDSSGSPSSFGIIHFNDNSNPTSFTTTELVRNLPAHSGTWDPYSQTIVVYGENVITQVNLDGSIYSQANVGSGITMDQGGLDGQGHAFIADNNGHLVYVSYRNVAGKKVENAYVATPFLSSHLDDIAPLIGVGGTC